MSAEAPAAEFFVTAADGCRIAVRERSAGRPAAVLIAPGFFQSKDTPTYRRIEEELAASFDVFAFDFRGHGRSGGFYTFSAREPGDLRAVADAARGRHAKLGVLGFSYGGAIAIVEQSLHGGFASLVCVGAPAAPDLIEFRWWRPEALGDARRGLERGAGVRPGNPFLPKRPALEAAARLGPTPVLFIHGSRDATVGVRHSRLLYERASGPKELKIFEGATHAQEVWRRAPREFMDLVVGWFRRTLA